LLSGWLSPQKAGKQEKNRARGERFFSSVWPEHQYPSPEERCSVFFLAPELKPACLPAF